MPLPPPDLPDWWPLAHASDRCPVAGWDLHVQAVGQGPLLLFLHGTGAGAFSWAPLVERLATSYRCLLLDLPGHGFTRPLDPRQATDRSLPAMAAVVRALLTARGDTPIGIVGHSAGAAIGWRLLLDGLPGRLLGIGAALVPPPAAYDRFARWWVAPIATAAPVAQLASALAREPATVEAILRRTGSTPPAALVRCYATLAATPAQVQGAMSMMAQWALRPLLRDAATQPCPVHLLHGAEDPFVPLARLREVVRSLPGVTLDVLPGGHLLHETDPDAVARVVRASLPANRPATLPR